MTYFCIVCTKIFIIDFVKVIRGYNHIMRGEIQKWLPCTRLVIRLILIYYTKQLCIAIYGSQDMKSTYI